MQGELNVLLEEITEKKKVAQNKKGCYRNNRTKLLPRTLCEDILTMERMGQTQKSQKGDGGVEEDEEESVQVMQWSS